MRKSLMGLLGIAILAGFLASCSGATPREFNIAYVIGAGAEDAREIKAVVQPGQRVDKESDDVVEYVYANPRNFVISTTDDKADWTRPLEAQSKYSEEGKVPGYPVLGELTVYFALNRDEEALRAFYIYCKKYNCDTSPDDNPEEQNISTDPGWSEMLREGMKNVLDHSFTATIAEYDVSIVNQPDKWEEVAFKMAERFMEEMSEAAGMNGLDPFCTTNVVNGGECDPVRIEITSLKSPDADQILDTRRDQENRVANERAKIESDREIEAERAALEQLRADNIARLYRTPGYAEERRMENDLAMVQACGDQRCIVTIGGSSPGVQLQVPSP